MTATIAPPTATQLTERICDLTLHGLAGRKAASEYFHRLRTFLATGNSDSDAAHSAWHAVDLFTPYGREARNIRNLHLAVIAAGPETIAEPANRDEAFTLSLRLLNGR